MATAWLSTAALQLLSILWSCKPKKCCYTVSTDYISKECVGLRKQNMLSYFDYFHKGYETAFWALLIMSGLSNELRVCSAAQLCQLFEPHGLAHPAPLSMELPRQEYWSGLPFPSRGSSWPRDRTHVSCIGRQVLCHWATWEAKEWIIH